MKSLNTLSAPQAAASTDVATLGQLLTSRGLPSYAGVAKGPFNPAWGAYNFKMSNLRKTHAAILRALGNTGKCNILAIGDSAIIGYAGTGVPIEANSLARRLAQTFSAQLGIQLSGTGISPVVSAANTSTDRWSFTGTVSSANYGLLTMNASSTASYTSQVPGTSVDIYYTNQSTNFTYQIDGATAVNVTPTGAATWAKITVTGLAYANHVVKVNAATNWVFLGGARVYSANGIEGHSFGFGGSTANFGGATKQWTDLSTGTTIGSTRTGMWNISTLSPDVVCIFLGANDISQGDTEANAIAGLSTIRGWYPNADCILMGGPELSGTNLTNWNEYWRQKYELADTLDIPLIDYRSRTGDASEALANGLLGPDNTHFSVAQNIELGRVLGGVVIQSIGGLNDADMVPIPAPFTSQGPATVRTGTMGYPIPTGIYEIAEVRAHVGTAPTGASLIVDVNKNGTTIYGTQANRPTIAVSTTDAVGGVASVTTCQGGDYITIDIDQIGSTVAGSDLTVVISLRRTV